MTLDFTKKSNVCVGLLVDIVEDRNKETQEYTRGYIKRIISNKDCSKGIKVELTNGAIGHIKDAPTSNTVKKETFKFYNEFFYLEYLYAIWDKKNNQYYVLNRINKVSYKEEKTLLIFTSREELMNKIKGTALDNKNYTIKRIKRNKLIVDNFKDYDIDVFSINAKRKLSFNKMKEFEEYFKSF